MKVIGILGNAGSGKDKAGSYLVQECGYYSMAFADAIKVFCGWMFDWNHDQLWGDSEFRNAEDKRYPLPTEVGKGYLSPRYALQHLGTEWVRHFNPRGFVDFTLRRIAAIKAAPVPNWTADPLASSLSFSALQDRIPPAVRVNQIGFHIYISDCRFKNEVDAIQSIGGKVYRIIRPDAPNSTSSGIANHLSETEQRGIPDAALDGVINNDGSLEDLKNAILAINRRSQ